MNPNYSPTRLSQCSGDTTDVLDSFHQSGIFACLLHIVFGLKPYKGIGRYVKSRLKQQSCGRSYAAMTFKNLIDNRRTHANGLSKSTLGDSPCHQLITYYLARVGRIKTIT